MVLVPDSEAREIPPDPEDVQQPQDNCDYDGAVQDSLDGILHGDVVVNQPEQNPDHNQNHDELNQWHKISLKVSLPHSVSAKWLWYS
jgi:hypothetical protein